jgi:hypothetical protein
MPTANQVACRRKAVQFQRRDAFRPLEAVHPSPPFGDFGVTANIATSQHQDLSYLLLHLSHQQNRAKERQGGVLKVQSREDLGLVALSQNKI